MYDLCSPVKQADWNVKGMPFLQLHRLLNDLAECLIEYADSVDHRVSDFALTPNPLARRARGLRPKIVID